VSRSDLQLSQHIVSNCETKKERRLKNVEAYLCGAAPVQNIPLEPCHWMYGYAARATAPAFPEEAVVSKGPGGMTPGDGTFGLKVAPTTVLKGSVGKMPLFFPATSDDAVTDVLTFG